MGNGSQKSWSRGGSSKRKKPQPQTPATRQKLENNKAAQAWCKKKCDTYLEVITKQQAGPAPANHPEPDADDDEDDLEPEPRIDNENQIDIDINHGEQVLEPRPPQNIVEFLSSNTYKTRRVRDERAWAKFLQPMLVAYLRCSYITSEWGNPATWEQLHFREEKCRKKREFVFCSCTPDQVRLISQGYLGGSPTRPETAFSIRLIRSYHLTWKHRPIGVQPFALAHDEYLDAFCPLILINGTNQPRSWRRPMSCAIHAYRQILKARGELQDLSLQLSKLQKMATICPRCFGPGETSKRPNEPDYIVCLDGNFQHKRHAAASCEYKEIPLKYPSLFLTDEQVQAWAPGARQNVEIPLDPCTAQHTAAADRRCATTFKGFDDNGLMGMACRHDQFLAFINIVQSGKKSHFAHSMIATLLDRISEPDKPPKTVGVLYDIGCTLEKGLQNNDLFLQERERGQLKFGTSVFHAYVHRWSCQLDYNPRLNEGWGLSDGEGLERDWAFLDPLIALLRYVTKQHRLDALHFRALHRIFLGQSNIGRSLQDRVQKGVSTMQDALNLLADLERATGHGTEYFSQQWARQKTCQKEHMGNTNIQHLEVRLGRLIDLEESFQEGRERLAQLQRQRRRNMTDADFAELRSLPAFLNDLVEAIQEFTTELGGPEFQDMAEATDPFARASFRVRLAKENLYEAKVGVIEHQKRWSRADQGASAQQRFKTVMNTRVAALKRKWTTYQTQVENCQQQFPRGPPLYIPTLDEVHAMPISDPFWNIGNLTHPEEAWAVDEATQRGIEACRTLRSCQEEMRRIAREVRNVVLHSLEMEAKLNDLAALSMIPHQAGFPNGTRPIELVWAGGILSKQAWDESQEVLKAVHNSLSRTYCRRWMVWDDEIPLLLNKTQMYCDDPAETNASLALHWKGLMFRNREKWANMINGNPLFAEGLDDEDFEEHRLNRDDAGELYENGMDLAFMPLNALGNDLTLNAKVTRHIWVLLQIHLVLCQDADASGIVLDMRVRCICIFARKAWKILTERETLFLSTLVAEIENLDESKDEEEIYEGRWGTELKKGQILHYLNCASPTPRLYSFPHLLFYGRKRTLTKSNQLLHYLLRLTHQVRTNLTSSLNYKVDAKKVLLAGKRSKLIKKCEGNRSI
ncbi:hypothetical protein DFH28DRAFT_935886 [Melampsora americana]|nr:hypothetical protein DFH28DRAFT_935886 [Melampsora americana]